MINRLISVQHLGQIPQGDIGGFILAGFILFILIVGVGNAVLSHFFPDMEE